MGVRKRLVSSFLLSALLVGNTLSFQQKTLGSEVTSDKPNSRKGLFEDINRIISEKKKICIRGFCLDKAQFTENFLAKQIREIFKKHAPVTVSRENLYPQVSSPPGDSFRPSILNLQGASPEQIIPAGDYIIPVKVYHLQNMARSPNGHGYVLGQYGGSSKEVIAALNQAAASTDAPQSDLQNLSWAIQAGVSYGEMPEEMQSLVNTLIPQYRSALKPGWWEEIETIWNKSSLVLGLPSLQQFLARNLGDEGQNLLALKQVHERLVTRRGDWRNLSDIFLDNNKTPAPENVLSTPWSQLSDGVYARFVTEDNAEQTGLLLLRITETKVSQNKHTTNGNKGLPLLQIISHALTVYELYQIMSALVALPEGNQNNQPLVMSPDLSAITQDLVDIGIKFCQRQPTPRGRLSIAINMLCSLADGTPRVTKPR
jgi:hypothetical protein